MKTQVEKLLEMLNETSVKGNMLPEPLRSFGKIYGKLVDEQGMKSYARIPYMYEFNY